MIFVVILSTTMPMPERHVKVIHISFIKVSFGFIMY